MVLSIASLLPVLMMLLPHPLNLLASGATAYGMYSQVAHMTEIREEIAIYEEKTEEMREENERIKKEIEIADSYNFEME